MTQEELKESLDEIVDDANSVMDGLLALINKHVAEVIGEDEPEEEGGIFTVMRASVPSPDQIARNALKAEQRERGGLEE